MLQGIERCLLVVLGLALMVAPAAMAQPAEKVIRTFKLDPARGVGTELFLKTEPAYRAFRLRVKSGQIDIRKITMAFWNGQRVVESRRFRLGGGAQTPWLAQAPGGRRLRALTIEFSRQRGPDVVLELRGAGEEGAGSSGQVVTKDGSDTTKSRGVTAGRRPSGPDTGVAQRPAPRPPVFEPGKPTIGSKGVTGGEATTKGWKPQQAEKWNQTNRKAAAPPAGSGSRKAKPGCVGRLTCTPVHVFFGTNRTRDTAREAVVKRVSFGPDRHAGGTVESELTLGQAVVTVPRVKRRSGSILTPGMIESGWRWLTGQAPEGDPDKHFVIWRDGMRVFGSEADFLRAIALYKEEAGTYKDHAFVFVHGYNTSFDGALMRTAQIAYDLGEPGEGSSPGKPFGIPFMFSWPSAGGSTWAPLLYPYDQESSRFAIEHFKHFLKLVIAHTGARKVHLIAHSMGNVPLLNALAGLEEWADGRQIVEQVILASPDVDIGEFKRLAAKVRPLTGGMTLYASSRDSAMELSKKVHNGFPRAGDVDGSAPTVLAGIHTIDISSITTCYFCTGHTEYVDQKDLLNDITRLLREDRILPPHERTPVLKPQEVRGLGSFWRYYEQ